MVSGQSKHFSELQRENVSEAKDMGTLGYKARHASPVENMALERGLKGSCGGVRPTDQE